MRSAHWIAALAALCLFGVSCSTAPQPPKPGTPAFIWGAAHTTYAAGDVIKAADNLSQLVRTESDFSVRAQPMLLVLSTGLAQGYMDLAENFETGARSNRTNPMPFRRQATVVRTHASAAALQAAEAMHKFLAAPKVESIALEFGYPAGSVNEPIQLQRVAKGMLFPDAEIEQLQKAMVQRGVLQSAIRAVGAGTDGAKALELFKAPEMKIARATFLMAMAKALHEEAALFGPKKLDQPQRVALLCSEAEAALKQLPEGKETKALLGEIAKTKKASKLT